MTEPAVSTWAPLASRIYRMLWIAQLVSNLGTWMQTVGAQWLLVGEPHATTLVALIQTATTLPVMLLSIPAGVLADLVDRRRLLIWATIGMAATATLLAVVTAVGPVSPVWLLAMLFVMGCGQALTGPAWQAIQPELVPREQLPAASALGSLTVNVGRAVGPALAGVLVAATGPALVFGLNALSFVGVVVALLVWRRSAGTGTEVSERPLDALAAGLRFIVAAPAIRRVLVRSVLFLAPATALWALLPVAAHGQLGLSSAGYGLLLSALGAGAIVYVAALSTLRRQLGANRQLALSAALFALAIGAVAVSAPLPVLLPLLVLGGFGWLATLSTLNATMQLLLPGWVRARGLSVYLLIFMGTQALSALVWGPIAQTAGIELALWVAAALLCGCALSLRWLPLTEDAARLDLSPAAYWPEPVPAFAPAPGDGPVLVERSYRVPEEKQQRFRTAIAVLGRSRRRTGATEWRLFRDIGSPDRFLETFLVRSWSEHLEQHRHRLTAEDQRAQAIVDDCVLEGTRTHHLIEVDPGSS